eukprot:TRINITY_DN22022_c0_g1_i1.p1 TRINITY_DN22022_c0_g1~~TRINITY_DN22022_c0_g1_i1.p1  ORF type:complete len:424 (+),score=164.38 TRINITY_DN22022_c0_g1_i1:142-1413(+)
MKLAVNTAKLLRNVPLPDEIATVHDAAVVVDLGSGKIKAGFSGDDAPRCVVPCIEGKPPKADKKPKDAKDGKESFVCSQAYKMRERLDISYPIRRGLVQDWGDDWKQGLKDRTEGPIEKIFTHIYEDVLKTSLTDPNQPLLLSETPLTDISPMQENREKLCEILFESLGIPALYVAQSPVLSLYSYGRTTGMVTEIGFESATTAPIFEGCLLFHSMLQLNFGGMQLTDQVSKMLAENGTRFDKCHERFIAEYVKETLCQVSEDRELYEQSVADKEDEKSLTLPDGTRVRLDSRRWCVGESLFEPSLLPGIDPGKGIHQLALESVKKCDTDIAPTLFQNVVLSGGTSMTRGLPTRIETELCALAPSERIKVHASTERSQACWIGGSILASLPTFQDLWITKADYDEYGSQHPNHKRHIFHRNCF